MKKLLLLILATLYLLLPAYSAQSAVGDTKASCSSIANGAFLDVQAGSGEEWLIQGLWFEDSVELQRYDGTNQVIVAQYTQGYKPLISRVTNSNRIRVKNIHGSAAKLLCYEGVQTK